MFSASWGLFLVMYFGGILMAVGFEDWFLVWMGLEMNVLSFLSLGWIKSSFNEVSSLYKYFFVQALASGLFLMMVTLGGWVSLVLMMKSAVGPFFFWFPSVVQGLSWLISFLLMTAQSILPFILMVVTGGWEVVIMGLFSLILGVVGSFSQSSMMGLMAFSSVNHSGWMMVSMMIKETLWILYFLIYCFVLFMVMNFFMKYGLSKLGSLGLMDSMYMVVMVFSLAGVPPFLGFLGKWMILSKMVGIDNFMVFLLVFSSLIMVYIYFRILYGVVTGGSKSMVWAKDKLISKPNFIVGMIGTLVLPLFFLMF